jgi:hypothetical protein
MLPEFNEDGYLPPGVHGVALDEVASRFGQGSELRRVQAESLRWLVDLARRAGIERLVVDGSFVTDVVEPNDVDCVLLPGKDYPKDHAADVELRRGLPFIHAEIVEQPVFDFYVSILFATDRRNTPKGMVEVLP